MSFDILYRKRSYWESQESRPLLTTVLEATTFSYQDAVPSLLRLNKYLKISHSWIGVGSDRIVTYYSIRSKISNVCTALEYSGHDHGDMVVPRSCTVRFGQRSLRSSTPSVWNNLPSELKNSGISRQGPNY